MTLPLYKQIGQAKNAELYLAEGDIRNLKPVTGFNIDVIVNAANEELEGGGGVDGAIRTAAGYKETLEDNKIVLKQREMEYLPTGQSLPGKAFALSKYGIKNIIYTVGPINSVHKGNSLELLENCFRTSLDEAEALGLESIAYPLISTGIFSVPREVFAQAARNVLSTYQFNHVKKVVLCIYGDPEANGIIKKAFEK